jgi:hypothetical protein
VKGIVKLKYDDDNLNLMICLYLKLDNSVSDPDHLGSAFNWSPGAVSGGLKRAKMKREKNAAKRHN